MKIYEDKIKMYKQCTLLKNEQSNNKYPLFFDKCMMYRPVARRWDRLKITKTPKTYKPWWNTTLNYAPVFLSEEDLHLVKLRMIKIFIEFWQILLYADRNRGAIV